MKRITSGWPTTRPESLDRLHTDASCLLGIVTIGCDVGREFTAEREIQNGGDLLKIRLTMRADSKVLMTFFRDQGIYLFIALVVGAIFGATGQPINPFTVILYSLCIGNFLSPPMQWLHVLYERPFPYDWLTFLTLMCILMLPVYALTSVIVWWLAPPSPQSLGHLITTGWKLPFLITGVYGVMNFLYGKTKARLERRNVELQSMVQAGVARLEIQEEELQRAREIQESLLPKEIPQLPGFEVASAWQPARAVGGDYFDVLKLGKNRLAICIADVSGKGVPAALLMANVQASLRASVRDLDSPARVCSIINGMLCESIAADKFVTFFCGVLDAASRTFRYCNAGHPYPILVSSGGRIRIRAWSSAPATGCFYLPTALPKPRGRKAKYSEWKKSPHSPKHMRRIPPRGLISSCSRR